MNGFVEAMMATVMPYTEYLNPSNIKVRQFSQDVNDDELDQEVYFRLIDWFREVNELNAELPDYTIVDEYKNKMILVQLENIHAQLSEVIDSDIVDKNELSTAREQLEEVREVFMEGDN